MIKTKTLRRGSGRAKKPKKKTAAMAGRKKKKRSPKAVGLKEKIAYYLRKIEAI